jgi:hypothetical protein
MLAITASATMITTITMNTTAAEFDMCQMVGTSTSAKEHGFCGFGNDASG